MNEKEIISTIRRAVEYAKHHGMEHININNLEKLLNEIDEALLNSQEPSSSIAIDQKTQFRAELDSNLAQYKASIDSQLEHFRSVI